MGTRRERERDYDYRVNNKKDSSSSRIDSSVGIRPPTSSYQPPLDRRDFYGVSRLNNYKVLRKLGEGTFGEVHKARHIDTQKVVALKKIIMKNEKDGVPITALREIKLMKSLRHPNVLELIDMVSVPAKMDGSCGAELYMVFPYMDHDLLGLLANQRITFTTAQIKCYMLQLLEGLWYLHSNNVIHRDLKASNLLISNDGTLKIADFGLARPMHPTVANYTNCVVTRWYRPPELLLGEQNYTFAVDMWGVGCVLAQMLLKQPLFPGKSDIEQMDMIFELCGEPNHNSWPNWQALPKCQSIHSFPSKQRHISHKFAKYDKLTVDMLEKCLILSPNKRLTAEQALDHPYFFTKPLPAEKSELPNYESCHEYDIYQNQQPQIVNKRFRSSGLNPVNNNSNNYSNQMRRYNDYDSNRNREFGRKYN